MWLVSWRADEAQARAEQLTAMGYEVRHDGLDFRTLRQMRDDPPDTVVIDLTRLPSQGRDIGLAVRYYKDTHRLPIVYAGGDSVKVSKVKESLPDAIYVDWDQIAEGITKALTSPPEVTTTPASLLDGYAGKPLPAKLGLKAGMTVLLAGEPGDRTEATFAGLGPEIHVLSGTADPGGEAADIVVWFVRSMADLSTGMAGWAERAAFNRLWIAWPKKAASPRSDVGQQDVRKAGLAAGLVDFKVAGIDEHWTALAFTRRE